MCRLTPDERKTLVKVYKNCNNTSVVALVFGVCFNTASSWIRRAAHPYYPQDKEKVERTIRNVAEEFIYLLKKFPEWLQGKLEEYHKWYNNKRYHRGIHTIPAELLS